MNMKRTLQLINFLSEGKKIEYEEYDCYRIFRTVLGKEVEKVLEKCKIFVIDKKIKHLLTLTKPINIIEYLNLHYLI